VSAKSLIVDRTGNRRLASIPPHWRFGTIERIICGHFGDARMSIFSTRLVLALVLVALCPGGRTAHAQAGPVPYWMPGWPLGFGGNLPANSNWLGTRDDGPTRYNFPNGFFVGSEGGSTGLNLNTSGFNQGGAFGNFPSLSYAGTQFGYNFQNAPLTIYGGLGTLNYSPGNFGSFSSFDSTSSTLGYSMHAGVEYRPTSNLSLSLGMGVTQIGNGDINSLALPGASPLAFGAHR
jgi:Outer membrane protein beta-barrel domain